MSAGLAKSVNCVNLKTCPFQDKRSTDADAMMELLLLTVLLVVVTAVLIGAAAMLFKFLRKPKSRLPED
jgi:hypothetical protein